MYKLLIVCTSLLVVGVLLMANVSVSASLAKNGAELKQLEQEKAVLMEKNEQLKTYVLEQQSILSLREEAEKRGFVDVTELVSIDSPEQRVAYTP